MKTLELTNSHRGGKNSYSFSGRPNGRKVREELGLDNLDKKTDRFMFKMPNDTTSFNPSFFLGCFFDSIKKLEGVDNFLEKYSFDYESIDKAFRDIIKENILDSIRVARNEYEKYIK